MNATELPELRREVDQAAEAYRTALSAYFDVTTQRAAPPVVRAAAQKCREFGANYDAALGALFDALWFPLNDAAHTAEQQAIQARRRLLAAELRLLA